MPPVVAAPAPAPTAAPPPPAVMQQQQLPVYPPTPKGGFKPASVNAYRGEVDKFEAELLARGLGAYKRMMFQWLPPAAQGQLVDEMYNKAHAPTEEERQCEGFNDWAAPVLAAYRTFAEESATGAQSAAKRNLDPAAADAYLRWLYRLQLAFHAGSGDRGVLAAEPIRKAVLAQLKAGGAESFFNKVRNLQSTMDGVLQARSQSVSHEEMMKKDKGAREIVITAIKTAFDQAGFPNFFTLVFHNWQVDENKRAARAAQQPAAGEPVADNLGARRRHPQRLRRHGRRGERRALFKISGILFVTPMLSSVKPSRRLDALAARRATARAETLRARRSGAFLPAQSAEPQSRRQSLLAGAVLAGAVLAGAVLAGAGGRQEP